MMNFSAAFALLIMCHLPFNLILRENVSQLLRDCLGRNIDAVRIYQWANQDDSVLNLLDEMQFTKLKFDGSKIINEHVDRIVNICEKHTIEELYLSFFLYKKKNYPAMDSLSPFEKLPCELVCMIIDYTPESFFQIGEVSKMMRSHTNAYVLKPATFAYCALKKDREILTSESMTESLFAYELKDRVLTGSDSGLLGQDQMKVKKEHGWPTSGMRSGNTICSLPLDLVLRDNFLQLLMKCMGSKIDTVRIYQWSTQEATVFKLLDGINDRIVNICETQSIEELFLYCKENVCSNPVNTLLKFASLVNTIVIEQGHNENVLIHHYFFGLTNADWAPIILDMFSRKMDKLSMADSFGVVGCLSANSADILRARLPWIGKKVWFDAVGNGNAETHYTLENDHIIRGPTANRRGFSLTIKKMEPPEKKRL
ncbi:hypothetical protein PRIPAC_78047 [Pristionchus pacificus]|uniref:Uncharacterized protein n=1 Tax=Pristionchus pacificus TaxID=54126 RepID=A0A2A6BHQ8_PRIPA|nr:hypothetical protein PRIPAC_78047 [Pristionchus pacificus]|eukprot:PDM65434.1 hypothetical protein PRIPAC_52376 [Pristionchus pacificus]